MRQRLIAAAFLLLGLVPAVAQQLPPTVPDHTVFGRLGTGSSSGPLQAVPFSLLTPQLYGTQSANTVYAGPASGSVNYPSFRALVGADLPTPTGSSLGGIESITCATHQWLSTVSTGGVPLCSQPAFSDISGTATGAQLPTPTATTLGGIESYVAVTHQWINTISTAGVPSSTQPACGDLSNAATSCSTDATNASNISSGTLAAARYAAVTLSTSGNGGVTGTLPIANGGTNDTGTAWSSFTASPTCGTATITTNSAKSKSLGKTIHFELDLTISSIGTCTNSLTVTLPFTANSGAGAAGRNTATNVVAYCSVAGGSASMACAEGANANFANSDHIIVSGVAESQ